MGPWSVRRLRDPEILIFVHVEEQRVEVQPPAQVLEALQLDANGVDHSGEQQALGEEPEEDWQPASGCPGAAALAAVASPEPASPAAPELLGGEICSPRFQRIVLGARCDMPLKMARDILEVLREDSSMFSQVQRRFSDAPHEPALGLGEGGLEEDLEQVALALQVGELSEVVGTEAGSMHILLRIS